MASEGLPDDEELLSELVTGIAESTDPLSYCGRVLAASLVSMRGHFRSRVQEFNALLRTAGENGVGLSALEMLPGFALGLAYALRENSRLLGRLTEYGKRYQSYLRQMDEEARSRLLRFSREVMAVLHLGLTNR